MEINKLERRVNYQMEAIVTAVSAQATAIGAEVPALVTAALGVGILIFGARLGWRLIKSLARG